MGIFNSLAESYKGRKNKKKRMEETEPVSGIRSRADASAESHAKNKLGGPYRRQALQIAPEVNREDLMNVLYKMVQDGIMSREEFKNEIGHIAGGTVEKIIAALRWRKRFYTAAGRDDLVKIIYKLLGEGKVSADTVNNQINARVGVRENKLKEKGRFLPPEKWEELLGAVRDRFMKNMKRHPGIKWKNIEERLRENPEKIWSLNEMERTGGEPDVIGYEHITGEYIFMDCSALSPVGRIECFYDRAGQDEAEQDFTLDEEGADPTGNALDMAAMMGIELLTPEEYRNLSISEDFDKDSLCWLKTPKKKSKKGKALIGFHGEEGYLIKEGFSADHDFDRSFRGRLKV